MRWGPEQTRQLHSYLHEDTPTAPYTSDRCQNKDTQSRAAEIFADMAAWNVSTAKVAAATMNPYDMRSSTNTFIHQKAYKEGTNEATPGISGMIRDGRDSSSTFCANIHRAPPGQLLMEPPTFASLASPPFDAEGISETRRKNTAKEEHENVRQVGRGHNIRQEPVGSTAATTVLDQETRSMSKTLLKCRYCPREFCKGSRLREHERVHTRQRTFKCDVCSKYFPHSSSLLVHRRTHTGGKRFTCKVCQASFTASSSLHIHERNHTGERPYKCETCDALFKTSSELRCHTRIHTGERPYKCEKCELSFKHLSTLRVHERIHTRDGPYKCKTCGASFTRLSSLHSHERMHKLDRS